MSWVRPICQRLSMEEIENRYLGGVANMVDCEAVEAVWSRVETPLFNSSRRSVMLFLRASP